MGAVPKPSRLRPIPVFVVLATAAALLLSACTGTVTPRRTVPKSTSAPTSGSSSGAPSSSASTSAPASPTAPPAKPVHISLLNSDGSLYGVGMPVIAYFSKKITSGKALQDATTATVNGKKMPGAWYFEYSGAGNGPIEAHYRLKNFWPAHSHVHINIPAKGLSAGTGLAYNDSLTLDFSTGAKHIGLVDDGAHTLTITSDGHKYGTFPVSLGLSKTPTKKGIKVIMEKGRDISMKGPGYYDPHVRFTQRLTYGGEYLHAAPWNCTKGPGCVGPQNNIGHADSSNGCTNLKPSVAKRLYGFLRIGDVVQYPNASGPEMQLGQGYGDWNLSWSQWQTGGLVSTTA